jgi:hypothetical protein
MAKTESQFTQSFHRRIRERFPKWVVTKLNDSSTSGLPDACITGLGRTLWVEYKVAPNVPTKLQLHTLAKLDAASHGRALLVTFLRDGATVLVSRPGDTAASKFGSHDEAIDYLFGVLEFAR